MSAGSLTARLPGNVWHPVTPFTDHGRRLHPNPEMHILFSPTYGSDNSPSSKGMDDEYQGKSIKRVKFDQDNPAAGAYRDGVHALQRRWESGISKHLKKTGNVKKI